MCGIAGFVSLIKNNPNSDPAGLPGCKVERMLARMKHRGPDQGGIGVYGGTAIGMNRLSIVDHETHEIPYLDTDKKFAVVYNGEIYNHESIKAGLKNKYRFKTVSDAETVLYNFIEKGADSFKEYNGMYAICVHDIVSGDTYVARDKAGEKPLYYIKTAEFIAFASEMKALFEIIQPLSNIVTSYRTYEFFIGKETMFKGVFQLEPGEYLKIDRDGDLTVNAYWKLWDNIIEIEDDLVKIEKDLTELLEDAILLRTKNCAYKYATFISGGVDSALITCIAKPQYIYHCHYDLGKAFNELEYAQLVAKKINTELILVEPKPEDFERTRAKIAYHLDTPCTWTSFSLWMLLERAHKDIRVVMTGEGADEAFAGYHRYHLLNHDEQIRKLEAMQEYDYLINRYYGSPVDRYSRLVNRCDNIYDAEVLKYLNETIGFYFEKAGRDVIHAMGLNDFYSTMQVLLQMSDRINMAFSVENRSPYLDYRLLQYAFSMPSKYKINEGVTKWIIKKIARKFIPHEIADRIDKRGFSAPVNIWFGWDQNGKYNRSAYREMVYNDWKEVFGLK
jgi:asparagine synthase (glutamine-hydrolysing)